MKKGRIAFLLGYPEISGGTYVILEHAVQLTKLGFEVAIVTELPIDRNRLAWHPEGMKLPLLSHQDCGGEPFDIAVATWWRSVYNLPWVPAKHYAYFVQSIETRFFSDIDWDMKSLADFTYKLPLSIVTEATWIQRYLQSHYGREATLVRNGIRKDIYQTTGPIIDSSRPRGLRVLVEGPLGVSFKNVERSVLLCRQAGIEDIWLLTSSNTSAVEGVNRVFSRVPITEVGPIYRSCDVLLKLSIVEGMFGPPLEMMHCGGTAITYDVSGHDEYIRHGENSLVCPVGAEDEVVNALHTLQRSPNLLQSLRAEALKTADNWPDWRQAGEAMGEFMSSLIAKPRSSDDAEIMRIITAALQLAGPLSLAVQHRKPFGTSSGAISPSVHTFIENDLPTVARMLRQGSLPKLSGPLASHPASSDVLPKRCTSSPANTIAFLGDPRTCKSLLPSSSVQFQWSFIPWTIGQTDIETLKVSLDRISPDAIFIFDLSTSMQVLRFAQKLGIPVHAVFVRNESPEQVLEFAKILAPHDRLYHTNGSLALAARQRGVQIISSAFLAISPGITSDISWSTRAFDVLVLGSPPPSSANMLGLRKWLHLPELPAEDTLMDLIRQSRIVVHTDAYQSQVGIGVASAHVLRDATLGALTITPRLDPNYGCLPGEHYIRGGEELSIQELATLVLDSPERFEIIPAVMRDKAAQYTSDALFNGIFLSQNGTDYVYRHDLEEIPLVRAAGDH